MQWIRLSVVVSLTVMFLTGFIQSVLHVPLFGFIRVGPEEAHRVLSDPMSWVNLIIYMVLMLFPLLTLYLWLRERRLYSGDYTKVDVNGTITITGTAMRKFIRVVCMGIPGIDDLRVSLKRAGSGLAVRVLARVDTPESWLSAKNELLRRIPEEVSKVIGEDIIRSLEIVCQDLARETRTPSRTTGAPAAMGVEAPRPWSPNGGAHAEESADNPGAGGAFASGGKENI